jgi:branched-chain amino acid transport system permease protein
MMSAQTTASVTKYFATSVTTRHRALLLSTAVVVAVLAVPLVLVEQPYYLYLLTLAAIYYIVAVGLVLVFGLAGQLSLAHGAFFGIGAYTSAMLAIEFDVPVLLGFVAGAVLAGALAWLLARPLFRLKGFYLAMGTLAVGEIIVNVFEQEEWLTRGSSGIVGLPAPSLGSFSFLDPASYYYLAAGVALLALWVSRNIVRSEVGRSLKAIAGSEVGATASGVNVARNKTWVFIISAALAAVAGSLYVHFSSVVTPSNFTVDFAILIIEVLAVGGLDSIVGAVFGAAFLVFVPSLLAESPRYGQLLFAVVFLAVVVFMPRGIAGLSASVIRAVSSRLHKSVRT